MSTYLSFGWRGSRIIIKVDQENRSVDITGAKKITSLFYVSKTGKFIGDERDFTSPGLELKIDNGRGKGKNIFVTVNNCSCNNKERTFEKLPRLKISCPGKGQSSAIVRGIKADESKEIPLGEVKKIR